MKEWHECLVEWRLKVRLLKWKKKKSGDRVTNRHQRRKLECRYVCVCARSIFKSAWLTDSIESNFGFLRQLMWTLLICISVFNQKTEIIKSLRTYLFAMPTKRRVLQTIKSIQSITIPKEFMVREQTNCRTSQRVCIAHWQRIWVAYKQSSWVRVMIFYCCF